MVHPVMNNTKWDELRREMLAIEPNPAWSTVATNGHAYGPDREWFFHFHAGGYETILRLDIMIETEAQRHLVRSALQRVHVPGEEMPDRFRVFGYLQDGEAADYI